MTSNDTTLMKKTSARGIRKKHLGLILAPVAVALVVAGCGGGGSSSGASAQNGYGAPQAAQPTKSSAGTALRLAKLEPGKALVDGQGRTLYLFEADKGTKSACNGACASIWPPATASGKPAAGSGLSASLLGTTMRSDGATQLTFNGHPLYRYAADQKPGDDAGQGMNQFGGKWYVLNAKGSKIDDD
jgi:predicted lipoprotein with Yx(FWY)xxD motif